MSSNAINAAGWTWFRLPDLFRIGGTRTTPLKTLQDFHGHIRAYPYVTTAADNNGVAGWFAMHTEAGGVIAVDSAVRGYFSYQAFPFSASDHVEKLTPKFDLTRNIAMFLITVLNREEYRFNYGFKCSQTRLRNMKIRLPEAGGEPDWNYMESYIAGIRGRHSKMD